MPDRDDVPGDAPDFLETYECPAPPAPGPDDCEGEGE